jgi:hypothetical protein
MTCLAIPAPAAPAVPTQDPRHLALATAIAAASRCGLSSVEVLPLAELAFAVSDLAAKRGVHVPIEAPAELALVADDLATRNQRRGYSSFVPAGCLTGSKYSIGGKSFGYASEAEWGRDLDAALPRDHRVRLHALQHGEPFLAQQRLQSLLAANTEFAS